MHCPAVTVCNTKAFAEKFGFLGGRSFSSGNESLAFAGLQPLRKRLAAFFRKL
jgi:hypothetical protein